VTKKIFLFLLALSFFVSVPAATAQTPTPEESLKKNFPSLSYDGFRPSPVKGLYEVSSGSRILYYSPEAGIIIMGELIDKEGRNLTRERKIEILSGRLKDLPLDKALKIGSGKNVVVEFSDPDCFFCRKASEFLSKREDITRYIFFFPLSPRSEIKIRCILCAKDPAQAYKDAYSGKLDDVKPDDCKDTKAEETLKTHREAGAHLGIEGTPFFFINGKAVSGADMPLMEKLLGEKK
jgi:thiol:disulfide interchange protein DsbC